MGIGENMKNTLLTALTVAMLAGCRASDDGALLEAIRAKDTERVEDILAKGDVKLDPPQRPNQVNKPLAYAAAYGNLDIVKLILARGADINGQVAYGDVPLIKAAEHGNKDIIVCLLEQGADVNRPNAFGISPFIGFCAAESVGLVELGLKYGGKVNESYANQTKPRQGEKNYTALQAAVAYGRKEVLKVLLAHGGDPSVKDASGHTCLDLARENGHEDIVQMLK
jgi:ankyrin repeat protein